MPFISSYDPVSTVRYTELPDGSKRVLAVDALRGFDMFWIAGGEEIVHGLDEAQRGPQNPVAAVVHNAASEAADAAHEASKAASARKRAARIFKWTLISADQQKHRHDSARGGGQPEPR